MTGVRPRRATGDFEQAAEDGGLDVGEQRR